MSNDVFYQYDKDGMLLGVTTASAWCPETNPQIVREDQWRKILPGEVTITREQFVGLLRKLEVRSYSSYYEYGELLCNELFGGDRD